MTEVSQRALHSIKCWPEVFEEMLAGRKTAEFRLNDRDYQSGDGLLIREWCPDRKEYTHREIERTVTHVLKDAYGVPKGYAMLSLADTPMAEAGLRPLLLAMEDFINEPQRGRDEHPDVCDYRHAAYRVWSPLCAAILKALVDDGGKGAG